MHGAEQQRLWSVLSCAPVMERPVLPDCKCALKKDIMSASAGIFQFIFWSIAASLSLLVGATVGRHASDGMPGLYISHAVDIGLIFITMGPFAVSLLVYAGIFCLLRMTKCCRVPVKVFSITYCATLLLLGYWLGLNLGF